MLWWPLPIRLTTHVPGSETWAFDEYTFVWNLWWFRHSLLDLGSNPLHSDWLFYPLGIDLVLYTYNIFNAAFALPLLDWLGPVLTSNLLLLAMTVLSGWGGWLLVRWLLGRTLGARGGGADLAAWGAGALYAFGAYRAVYAALGHYDMVSTGFIPLFTLFFLRSFWGGAAQGRVPRAPLLAGIFLAGALANEMIFGIFLALLALLLLLFTWGRRGRGWLGRLSLAAVVAALLWAPVGIPVVQTLLSTDYVLTGWGDALKLSADLLSFVSPTALHPLWGPGWVEELRAVQVNAVSPGASRFSDVNTVFVGIATLLLAVLAALRYGRLVRGWVVGLLAFMILALGPLLQVGGQFLWRFDNVLPNGQPTAVPLPFLLLHYLPVVQGNRAANRFSVVLMLCAAVLVGYALLALQRAVAGIPHRGASPLRARAASLVVLGAIALILLEQLVVPLPLTDARVPEGYSILAEDPDDVAVLTLPLGWRNSFGVVGAENTRNQFYQWAHGKRLIQGNISRAPTEKFDYWQNVPVIRSLIEIQNDRDVSDAQKAEDAARGAEAMALLGVRYLVVHPAVPGRPPYEQNRERALSFLEEVLALEPLYAGDDLLVYRVLGDAPASGQLQFGLPESEMFRVAGWSGNEREGDVTFNWAMGEASLLLPLAQPGEAMALTLQIRPFQLPQTMQPWVNGQVLGEPVALLPGWNDVALTIPAERLQGPTARITLRFSRADQPVEVLPGAASLGSTGVETRARIAVKSAAAGLSDLAPEGLAWITVNDQEASAHRMGTNVTVVDPATGAVEAVRGFDTSANVFEGDQLHAFLNSIPEGKIVIVALKGPATAFLNLDTVAALQRLGAATGPTAHGVSYALIGVAGAPVGSALEAQSDGSAVDLLHLPDERMLSSAVRSVSWRIEGAER